MAIPEPRFDSTPFRPPRGILEWEPAELDALVVQAGGRPVHARALRRSVLVRGSDCFDVGDGLDLPTGLVAKLKQAGVVPLRSEVAKESRDAEGSIKLGLRLADGNTVETVVMPRRHHNALCISTQVGCPVGCVFCASGLDGVDRNLTAGEILEQIGHGRRHGSVDRIVVMGIGEPLLNLPALLPALQVAVDEMGIPPKRITISTVGDPGRLEKLRQSGRGYSLAVSLHAPDDSLRHRLIPTQENASLESVIDAARIYADEFDGRVQFEYVVLAGVNDHPQQVRQLADQLRGVPGFVNFIPWNPVQGLPYRRPSEARLDAMVEETKQRGVLATRRRSVGQSLDAACGQLRSRMVRKARGA